MTERPQHEAHSGKDGWLFLVGGSNNVAAQYEPSFFITYQLELWRELILSRAARFAERGITYRHLVVPEKLSIYGHLLDGIALDERRSPAQRLLGEVLRRRRPWHRLRLRDVPRLRRSCVDLIAPLRAARGREDLYYRTDSHWSFAGCHLGYLRLCRSLRVRPRPELASLPFREAPFSGDLGGRFSPPRTETVRIYERRLGAERRYANALVEAREAGALSASPHTGSHVVYANARAVDPRRVVLFGDSCSHFDDSMLTILLAETFREVHFIWSTSLDWGYIDRARPDIVVTEIAERFMAQLPDDSFDVQAYVEDRYGAELRAYRSRLRQVQPGL